MAAFIRGLDAEETTWLTRAMMESGDVLDLSDITPDNRRQALRTGGVGDKLSLILAACGSRLRAVVP
jgi:pyrimidine-nucleoside phosphorylase/thymidine phosphorylase